MATLTASRQFAGESALQEGLAEVVEVDAAFPRYVLQRWLRLVFDHTFKSLHC